jgi:hypothetical protein
MSACKGSLLGFSISLAISHLRDLHPSRQHLDYHHYAAMVSLYPCLDQCEWSKSELSIETDWAIEVYYRD